jgi:hypothetical protein
MDYLVLFNEINTDPLGRGYSSMSDAEVAADLNTVYRTRNRGLMTASEVYNAVDETEFIALTAEQKAEVWNIVHMGELDPFGLEADRFLAIFGGGSTTISTLGDLRVDDISRAQELGLGEIYEGYVTKARALGGA